MYDLDKNNRNIKSNSSSYYDDKRYEEHGNTFDDDSNDYSNDYSNRYSDDIYSTEAERRSAGSNHKSTSIVTLLTWVVVLSSIFGGGVYLYKFSSDLEKDKKTRYTLEKPKNNKKTKKDNVTSSRPKWNNLRDDLVYSQEDETSNVSKPRPKKIDFWRYLKKKSKDNFEDSSEDNNKNNDLVKEEERNQKTEIEPVKKIDNKFNFNQDRLYTDNPYSDMTYLYEKRDYFLALPEKDLIDNFTNIYNYVSRRLVSKSTDERVYNVLKIVFFLKIAIDKDYPNLLKEIIDKKFEINLWRFNYLPILFYVADKDSRKCLDVLIDKETDLRTQLEYKPGQVCYISKNNSRPDGKTLYLFRAMLSKSEENNVWYESIINLEKDVFEKIDDDKIEYVLDLGKTLLHSAAQNGNISLAKKVLEAGVDIDSPTFRLKKTPLYFAVANNKYEMVKFLVENGAKVDEQILKLNIDSDMAKILEKR